ncbi:MAG: zinc permease [Nitrospira sp.]|nr:MAG: zinc permease [Nitrospira sp.]
MNSLSGSYLAVVLLAFLSGGTTLIGVALALVIGDNPKMTATGIGFSTGIMMLISLFELVPESLRIAGPAATSLSVGLGAALILSLHIVIPHIHLGREQAASIGELRAAYLIAFGLILHDVPEGFAMANAFLASPSLGVMVAVAIALHNIPEEFAMAVPAVAVKNRALLFKAAILSGLAEPAGAILGLLAVHVNSALNPAFMAFAAGAMVMVSLFELVPMARKYGRPGSFALGLAASAIVYFALHAILPDESGAIKWPFIPTVR